MPTDFDLVFQPRLDGEWDVFYAPTADDVQELGDQDGHPFRGNQYSDGKSFADDLNEQLQGDKPWNQSFLPPVDKGFRERLGQCYMLAGQRVLSSNDDIVHGKISNGGSPPLAHAWTVNPDSGVVHEPATDRDYTPEAFKKLFNPTDEHRYPHDAAIELMVAEGHFGPWGEGIKGEDLFGTTLEFGDSEGHPFHGNQWTDRGSSTPDPEFVGGLKPEDFPHGRYPGQVQAYMDYRHPVDPWSPTGARKLSESLPRGQLEWTKEEQAQALHNLAERVRTTEPTSRLPMASFKKIVEDGTIRNQFETGTTRAATGASRDYEPKRASAEELSFGVAKDAPGSERPVYGYFATGEHGDFLSADRPEDVKAAEHYVLHDDPNIGYGAATLVEAAQIREHPDDYVLSITPSRLNAGEGEYVDIVHRDRLADQMTRTDGYPKELASDRYYPMGDGEGNLNRDTILGFANKEYAANSYGDVQLTYARDVLDTATVTGGDSIDGSLMGLPARLVENEDPRVPVGMGSLYTRQSGGLGGNYVEVQMHEHPTLDDVEKVTFTGGKPTKAVQAALDERGVPWTYEPQPKMPKKWSLDEALGGRVSSISSDLSPEEASKARAAAEEARKGVLVASSESQVIQSPA